MEKTEGCRPVVGLHLNRDRQKPGGQAAISTGLDSEVFRSRTPGEPLDGTQRIVDCLPSSPTHSTMMLQRMFPPG
jgi:hypothetical protein